MARKIILHLCADIGSDSYQYHLNHDYEVVKVGKDIGVENFDTDKDIYGIFANPPCTFLSNAKTNRSSKEEVESAMQLVNHCMRIIRKCNPVFWVIENPATGLLREYMGRPNYSYQPWWYGSPWTKKTALWGKFNIPKRIFDSWDDVPKIQSLYCRSYRKIPSLSQFHKNDVFKIEEFKPFIDSIKTDADLRSCCSQKFAMEFFKINL